MLDNLFGSTARAKIIKFFCTNDRKKFYVRELAKLLDLKLNSLSRELIHLERMGLLKVSLDKKRKYYEVDHTFPLYAELHALIVKSIVLLEKVVSRELRAMRGMTVLLLTGIFVRQETSTDIVIAGTVDRKKIQHLIAALSGAFHQEIRFTIFSTAEYKYRLAVTDKFLSTVLNSGPIIILNKVGG